jgi:hypothetical protein
MFREREVKKIIAVAKKAGAKEVEIDWEGVKATIRLNGSSASPDAVERNEWLADDAAASR